MVQQIEYSDFVIVVVTEKYNKRFKMLQEDPRVGRGVTWEGAVTNSQVYRSFGSGSKFVRIVFGANDIQHIPFSAKRNELPRCVGLQPEDLAGKGTRAARTPTFSAPPRRMSTAADRRLVR
jgi:hypothetical protein